MYKRLLTALAVMFCVTLFWGSQGNAADENPQKENSWRYHNGQEVTEPETEPENGISLYSTQAPGKYKGIDVSHHNGTINWAKVKASGINYAIIRCGYGDNISSQDDGQWTNNVKGCIANNIPFGVYIYSYAKSTTQAASEADHVVRLLTARGLRASDIKFPIYLDMEDTSTVSVKSKFDDIATTFCNRMKSKGYSNVGIYASYSWFNTYLTASCFNSWTRWVARYNSYCGYGTAGKDYDMWQYSSTGAVSGISGKVDMNYWYGATLPTSSGSTGGSNSGVSASSAVTVGKPSSISNSSKSKTSLTVRWSGVSGAAGYQIFQSSARNGSYRLIKTVGASTYSFKNTGLSSGREYYYKVRAYKTSSGKNYYGSSSGILCAYTSVPYKTTAKVKTASKIRSYAGTAYGKKTIVYRNTSLKVYCYTYDKSGAKWFRVRAKRGRKYYYGYIKASLTKATYTGRTTTALKMRKKTSTSSKKVITIPKGKTVTIKKTYRVGSRTWYRVSYKKGRKTYSGYVVSTYIKA